MVLCHHFTHLADATPTEAEQDTWNCVDNVLKSLHGILDELQTFESASNEIRLVIFFITIYYNCLYEKNTVVNMSS